MITRTSARIKVELDLSVPSNYGSDWKLDEIYKQVEKEAVLALENHLRTYSGGYRLIGPVQVLSVSAIVVKKEN